MRIPKAAEPETRQALIIACGVWAATVPVFMAPSLAAPQPAPAWAWLATGLVALAGVILTPFLLWVVRAGERWRERRVRLAAIVAAVVVVALIHSAFDTASHDILMSIFKPNARGTMFMDEKGGLTPAPLHYYVLINFISLLWVHAGVTALAALSRFNWRVRRRELATAEARATANQAKLATIRLQLNPHFLFNTLNAISSLVLTERNSEAESMLARLSDFLRASLGPEDAEQVSLASELSAVGAYLDIESQRFGGRMEVEVVCDENLHEATVPTFLLQPLAEQAVAHAISPPKRRVVIRVQASVVDADGFDLTIEARALDGTSSSCPPPLDLSAVRGRLAAVYGDQAEIEGASDAEAFVARARVRLRQNPTSGGD
jgi:hypothetical protein